MPVNCIIPSKCLSSNFWMKTFSTGRASLGYCPLQGAVSRRCGVSFTLSLIRAEHVPISLLTSHQPHIMIIKTLLISYKLQRSCPQFHKKTFLLLCRLKFISSQICFEMRGHTMISTFEDWWVISFLKHLFYWTISSFGTVKKNNQTISESFSALV